MTQPWHHRVVLVFCHLFIGAIVGLLLFHWTGRRWLVAACAVGAVLPDLIDKPLGHLFLQGSLDSGRIFAHSLLFLALVIVAALIVWKARSSLFLAAVAAGIGTHLVLDSMWDIPNTLFYPALGPFLPHHYPDYFATSLVTEMTSPMEWLFAIALAIIVLNVYRDSLWRGFEKLTRYLTPVLKPCLVLTMVLGVLYMILGAASGGDWVAVEADLILGLSAVLGASLLLWLDARFRAGNKSLF